MHMHDSTKVLGINESSTKKSTANVFTLFQSFSQDWNDVSEKRMNADFR